MKYLKELVLSHIKQQFSDEAKAKDCSQLASLMRAPQMQVIMEIFNSNKKLFHVFIENLHLS